MLSQFKPSSTTASKAAAAAVALLLFSFSGCYHPKPNPKPKPKPEPAVSAPVPSATFSRRHDAEIKEIIQTAPDSCWQLQKPADVWNRIQETRQRQAVIDVGAYRPDIFGIAAPLLAADGAIQGALSMAGLRHGHNLAQLKEWRDLVVRKARELNQFTQLRVQKNESH